MFTLLDHNSESWELEDASKDDLIRLCHYLQKWAKEQRSQELERAYDEGFHEGYGEARDEARKKLTNISPALASKK